MSHPVGLGAKTCQMAWNMGGRQSFRKITQSSLLRPGETNAQQSAVGHKDKERNKNKERLLTRF